MAGPTFQFTPQPLTQRLGASGAAPRLGSSGGVRAAGVQQASRWGEIDPNIGANIPDFLDEMLAPAAAAEKQRRFYEGFTAARAGKTVNEIADEQPWYANIFGPSSYELGATTFAVQKSSADMESQFLAELPELRKQAPEEIGKRLNQIASENQTGNFYADAVIQKSIMERAGPMMDAHMKARVQWQQEELAKGQNQAWLGASQAFQLGAAQQAKQDGRIDPEKLKERAITFLSSFQAVEGQHPDSYLTNMMTTVDQMADRGDWFSIRALESSGLFGQMNPDDQDKLQGRIDRARSKFKTKLASGPLMQPIAQLFTQARAGAISAEQATTGLVGINAQYEMLTGDNSGLFDQDDAIKIAESAGGAYYSMWERMMNKRDTALEKAQDAAAKEAAEARGDATIAAAVGTHSAGTVQYMKNVSKDDIDRSFSATIQANPERVPDIVVGNFAAKDPYVSERLKQRLRNDVALSAGEEYNEGFKASYEQWKLIRYHNIDTGSGVDTTSGIAAAMEYYGDYHDRMQQFDDQIKGNQTPELAYRRTFGNEASWGNGDLRGIDSEATKTARAALVQVVKSENPSWWEFGSDAMGASASNLVTQASSRYFQQLKANSPELQDKDAAAKAIQLAKANGLEITGKYAWQNSRVQKPMHAEAGMQPEVFSKLFDETLTQRFRVGGMSVDKNTSIQIVRLGNDSNGPRLVAMAMKDGVQKTIWIDGKAIKELRDKKAKVDVERQTGTSGAVSRDDIDASGFAIQPLL